MTARLLILLALAFVVIAWLRNGMASESAWRDGMEVETA